MHRSSASVFLFCDIKISFGAFASTDSYVDLFSTPEKSRHKDAPARFHLAPKGHLLVCSAAFAILPVDVLLAAKKATLGPRHHAAIHKNTKILHRRRRRCVNSLLSPSLHSSNCADSLHLYYHFSNNEPPMCCCCCWMR